MVNIAFRCIRSSQVLKIMKQHITFIQYSKNTCLVLFGASGDSVVLQMKNNNKQNFGHVPLSHAMLQWFDCHLLGCCGFTEYFPAKRRELHWLSPTTKQSAS